jgi:tetratricopeptide (TPR) repeat protein
VAIAEAYRGYAWAARGSGTGDTVSESNGKKMSERLGMAFEALGEARKLPLRCPGWHGTLIRLSLGAQIPRAEYEEFFQAAIKAFPDYGAIYDYKSYYLLPRWYGERGEWETFAREMMTREDIPQSKEIFARAAIYLRSMGYLYEELSQNEKAWAALKESFREIEKNYPDSLEIKSIYCRICAKLFDYKEAREQFKLLNNQVDLSVWGSQEQFLKLVNWLNTDDASLEIAK